MLNHKTLMQSELPLLTSMGFEIYIPKIVPTDEGNMSVIVNNSYDQGMTISKDFLNELNYFNFYSQKWNGKIVKKINQNFGVAFCAFFPDLVNNVLESFSGKVFLRAFGRDGSNNYATFPSLSKKTITRIQDQNNVWFAQAYDNLTEVEPFWIRRISVHLPIGVGENPSFQKNSWSGKENRILFICSRIRTSPYYTSIYDTFIKDFGNFPHTIAGHQLIPVNEANVIENLPDEDYYELFKQCKVMFYHSREERHLHYHPLEAIVIGMPVIYMSGGMLDHLAGEKLPNSCETIQEAKEKIKRVLDGDEEFISLLQQSQQKIFNSLSPQKIMFKWQNNFLPLINNNHILTYKNEELTLGIFIPIVDIGPFFAEGIMRLLGFLIPIWQEQENINIRIACASWNKPKIQEYLSQSGAALSKITFITTNQKGNVAISIFKLLQHKVENRRKNKRNKKNLSFLFSALKKYARQILSEIFYQWWLTLLLSPVLIVLGIFFGFFYFTYIVIHLCYKTCITGYKIFYQHIGTIKEGKETGSKIKELISRAKKTPSLIISTDRLNQISWGKSTLRRLLTIPFHLIGSAEINHLCLKMSKAEEIDCWYFPFPRGNNMEHIKKPIVVALPDLVHLEFPTRFNAVDPNFDTLINDIILAINHADATISYSKYIRDTQVVQPGYHDAETAYVIPHAPIKLNELLDMHENSTFSKYRVTAIKVINEYVASLATKIPARQYTYLSNIQFGNIKYLFVSSQNRPYKNYLNMVKAYEKILREEYQNVKLIITGAVDKELGEFIESRKLHLDVISLHNLPANVHAAFYACAELSLVPSLFEGGFPFVFSESLSVGTPVLLSNIPVVREVLSSPNYEKIIFNPYNIQDIVNKTKWALTHREELINSEMKIFAQMKSRTWNDVAQEYYRVFKVFANKQIPDLIQQNK